MLFRFHNDNTTPKVNWNGKEYDVHRIAGCSDFDIIKIEDSKPFKKEITCFDIELEDNYIEDVYMVPLYGDRRTGVFFDASWDTEKDGNKPLEDYFKGKSLYPPCPMLFC